MMKHFGKKVYRHSGFSSLLSVFALVLFWCVRALAADYSDGDIHKNDSKWFQFSLMQSLDNKLPFGNEKDTYLEMEFGGRSGILNLYGYVDVFDIFNREKDDLHKKENFFLKAAPRFSLDVLFKNNLSFGPVKELYLSTLANIADAKNNKTGAPANGLFEVFAGLGADIEVPWFGKIGSNVMARYVRENYSASEEKKWNGYIWTSNWFKPFHFFENRSFIAYQGYLDYKFGYGKLHKQFKDTAPQRTKTSLEWYNGFYWHCEQWSLGYGLKYYKDMANFKDGAYYPKSTTKKQNTSGFGHFLAAIYKF